MVDGMSINMGRSGAGINENVGLANGIVLNTADRAGSGVHALGEPGRIGDRRRSHQHRAANRWQPLLRQVRDDVHAGQVLRPQHRHTPDVDADQPESRRPARNAFDYDYDMTGAFGGPVVKDRVWFYLQGRIQNRQSSPARRSAARLH